ncbi:30S ribosomal protein s18 [Trifolium pratense]|uniref:30S ribosomal protein s18 n=1 Tax=Trifolium pratense TaxID=57577 RepID=A0A2K3MFK4_TRIPR|nr:30S ribosomal protein s18 [Trifolium pratense]
MAYAQPQKETKTIPLKVVVNTYSKKVVFVEATKDFVDTLFSFLSLPLGTIVRLLATTNNNNDQQQLPESSPFLENIKNLYQNVQNITSNDVWNNPACKQILLRPRNPCESMCNELFLNIDDTESTSKFYVCSFCDKFTTFENLNCTCGNPPDRQPRKLDSDDCAKFLADLHKNGDRIKDFKLDSAKGSHMQHWRTGGNVVVFLILFLNFMSPAHGVKSRLRFVAIVVATMCIAAVAA